MFQKCQSELGSCPPHSPALAVSPSSQGGFLLLVLAPKPLISKVLLGIPRFQGGFN